MLGGLNPPGAGAAGPGAPNPPGAGAAGPGAPNPPGAAGAAGGNPPRANAPVDPFNDIAQAQRDQARNLVDQCCVADDMLEQFNLVEDVKVALNQCFNHHQQNQAQYQQNPAQFIAWLQQPQQQQLFNNFRLTYTGPNDEATIQLFPLKEPALTHFQANPDELLSAIGVARDAMNAWQPSVPHGYALTPNLTIKQHRDQCRRNIIQFDTNHHAHHPAGSRQRQLLDNIYQDKAYDLAQRKQHLRTETTASGMAGAARVQAQRQAAQGGIILP